MEMKLFCYYFRVASANYGTVNTSAWVLNNMNMMMRRMRATAINCPTEKQLSLFVSEAFIFLSAGLLCVPQKWSNKMAQELRNQIIANLIMIIIGNKFRWQQLGRGNLYANNGKSLKLLRTRDGTRVRVVHMVLFIIHFSPLPFASRWTCAKVMRILNFHLCGGRERASAPAHTQRAPAIFFVCEVKWDINRP